MKKLLGAVVTALLCLFPVSALACCIDNIIITGRAENGILNFSYDGSNIQFSSADEPATITVFRNGATTNFSGMLNISGSGVETGTSEYTAPPPDKDHQTAVLFSGHVQISLTYQSGSLSFLDTEYETNFVIGESQFPCFAIVCDPSGLTTIDTFGGGPISDPVSASSDILTLPDPSAVNYVADSSFGTYFIGTPILDFAIPTSFSGHDFAFSFSAFSSGAPEPGTWTMMILGLGAAGAMLRGRRYLAV